MDMRSSTLTHQLVAALVLSACAGGTPTASLDTELDACLGPVEVVTHRDLAYAHEEGVDPGLLSLDVYQADVDRARCAPRKTLVFVHGGGWAVGDKRTGTNNPAVALYTAAGFNVFSVNYRLSPADGAHDPERIKHPVHVRDVARAVAWVRAHAGEYHGDPQGMVLVGFSAGAHLVSLAATDERRLGEFGVGLETLACVVSLDTGAYDVPALMESVGDPTLWLTAFGETTEEWIDASPVSFVAPGKAIPDFFLAVRGSTDRQARADTFLAALRGAGTRAVDVRVPSYTHAEVGAAPGADDLVTPPLERFLADCRQG